MITQTILHRSYRIGTIEEVEQDIEKLKNKYNSDINFNEVVNSFIRLNDLGFSFNEILEAITYAEKINSDNVRSTIDKAFNFLNEDGEMKDEKNTADE